MSSLLSYAQQFVSNVIQNNAQQNMVNAPWKDAALRAIQSGDQKAGEELAQNILQTYGFSSPEEAIRQGLQNLSSRGN